MTKKDNRISNVYIYTYNIYIYTQNNVIPKSSPILMGAISTIPSHGRFLPGPTVQVRSRHPDTWLQSRLQALVPRSQLPFANQTWPGLAKRNGGTSWENPGRILHCRVWFPEVRPWGLVNFITMFVATWLQIMLNHRVQGWFWDRKPMVCVDCPHFTSWVQLI